MFHLFRVLFSELSEPFCGFEADDVHKSEEILLDVKDESPKANLPANDNTCDGSEIADSQLQEPKSPQPSKNGSHDKTVEFDVCQKNCHNEKLSIVAEIVDKAVNNALDGEAIDQNGNRTTECIRLLKDDPETLLFLSYS